MSNAILLHGKPSKEKFEDPGQPKPHEANWLPWLRAELVGREVSTGIPRFPRPYDPRYPEWLAEFEKFHVDDETILVGHSAGAGFIVRWLTEHPEVAVAQAHLVAYYHDFPNKYVNFSKHNIDADLGSRVGKLVIYNSIDDTFNIQKSVNFLKNRLNRPFEYREFRNYGHFMLDNNMLSVEFPELLDEILTT